MAPDEGWLGIKKHKLPGGGKQPKKARKNSAGSGAVSEYGGGESDGFTEDSHSGSHAAELHKAVPEEEEEYDFIEYQVG